MIMKDLSLLKEGKEGFGILIENDAGYISTNNTYDKFQINENVDKMLFNLPDTIDYYVDCILQKFDTPNRNKRVYPENILKTQVNNYFKLVKDKSAVSEADHPATTTISLLNISHLITDMWWGKTNQDKHILYGKLKLILSPGFVKYGIPTLIGDKIYTYIILHGIKIGISSRGVGSVKEKNGIFVVQNDFELVGFDLVTTPSTIGAFLFPDGNVRDTVDEQQKIIKLNNENNINKFNHIDSYLEKIKNVNFF